MNIASVGRALPDNYYDQEQLLAAFKRHWGHRFHNAARLEQIHRNVLVGGRHLALPMEAYPELTSFTQTNDAFIRCAVELGERAVREALELAGLEPTEVDHLLFVSSTGVATPSVDARLVGRLGLRADVKRSPLFGLGCVAGASGIVRAADYLRAYPEQVAVLLSVELCSLTLQRHDLSIANIISSGLFGDGAAAVAMVGADRGGAGPRVVDTRAVLYPDTEYVMGWEIGEEGFKVVLSADVPAVVEQHARPDVEAFLSDSGLGLDDVSSFVIHPGGPRVLQAFETSLGLPREALGKSWKVLSELGNLSSASILMILRETMDNGRPPPGANGLMLAMGPGFCSEMVLLRW
jgi:alkylresorcinol/alkylpyrone synthase